MHFMLVCQAAVPTHFAGCTISGRLLCLFCRDAFVALPDGPPNSGVVEEESVSRPIKSLDEKAIESVVF